MTRTAADQSSNYGFIGKYLFAQISYLTCYELFQGTRLYRIFVVVVVLGTQCSVLPTVQLDGRRIECSSEPHRSLGAYTCLIRETA